MRLGSAIAMMVADDTVTDDLCGQNSPALLHMVRSTVARGRRLSVQNARRAYWSCHRNVQQRSGDR